MLKIAKSKLNDLYAKINESMGLYIPVKKAGEVNYAVWGEGKEVSLETLKTVKSPKSMFFPQTENMMKFKTEGKYIEIIDIRDEKTPFVLFGVKPCDYKAIEVLDKVFLADPVDTYYQARREATTIVTLACSKPEESCFCKVFDIDATAAYGDVTTWLDNEYLYWQANTEKGAVLTELVKALMEEGGEAEVTAQQEATKAIIEQLPFSNLDLSKFKPENLNELFNAAEWQEMSEACLGCGTCTFVYPFVLNFIDIYKVIFTSCTVYDNNFTIVFAIVTNVINYATQGSKTDTTGDEKQILALEIFFHGEIFTIRPTHGNLLTNFQCVNNFRYTTAFFNGKFHIFFVCRRRSNREHTFPNARNRYHCALTRHMRKKLFTIRTNNTEGFYVRRILADVRHNANFRDESFFNHLLFPLTF